VGPESPKLQNTKILCGSYGLDSVSLTEGSTLIHCFSRVSTSQCGKFAVSPQEYKYPTETSQWIGESKLFDNSNRYSSRTAKYSKNLKGGGGAAATVKMFLLRIEEQ
jgi:hypothetical protein